MLRLHWLEPFAISPSIVSTSWRAREWSLQKGVSQKLGNTLKEDLRDLIVRRYVIKIRGV